MSLNDESLAPPPGWSEGTEEELFESRRAEPENPRIPSPPPPSRTTATTVPSSPASAMGDGRADEAPTSYQGSSSSPLAEVFAEVLKVVAGGASIALRRRWGVALDLRMAPDEANALARPVAAIVSRRVQIKRELSDIRDSAGGAAAAIEYLERIFTQDVPVRTQQVPVARTAPSAGVPLAPEGAVPVPPGASFAPQAQQVPVRDAGGGDVPGAGPVRQNYLGGFD